ncbi:MAG: LacI family transcriptional regulator [Butyrivibrio sp.]|nr:LacI family transcriptional regulator [Butyrivibrio sp.]
MNLKDIAELAGVSTATVSNVLNGNYRKVSDETRKKVEKIVREEGYKPNAMARSLAKNVSRIIGVVVPYVGAEEDFNVNPYNAHMIAALERHIRSRDYYIMLRSVPRGKDVIPLLASWNVDGAFFLGVMEEEIPQIQTALDAPVVFIDSYASEGGFSNVGMDDYRGGFLSAEYLLKKGHRSIALVTPQFGERGVMLSRYNGFIRAFEEKGIPFSDKDIYITGSLYESAVKIGQRIASAGKEYTAVAAMSDIVAFGVIEGLRQCGKRVPEEVSVIGFDNLPESRYLTPKLTTIAQDFDEKAKTAVDMLFEKLSDVSVQKDIHLPVKIVERDSVIELK